MSASFPFAPAPFFAFRTPALPFAFLEAWSREPGGPLEADREALRRCLRAALALPAVRDALFLASPDLDGMLEPWLADQLPPERRDRVDRSLVRYLSRMASRCTPFGLFAGCSLGQWGEGNRLALGTGVQRHTRLDMDYLCALVEALEQEPAVRRVLRYRPNTSLYAAAGRLRYAEGRLHPERGREYHLVALDRSPYLEATLLRAAGGATLEALASPLAVEGVSLEEARAFIHELIDSQVLVSDLQPPVTGPEPIHGLVERLRHDPDTAAFAERLASVRDALRALDEAGPGSDPAAYRALARDLASLPAKLNLKFLFQVDLVKPAPGASLGPKVRAALTEALELLHRLTPPRTDPLREFREAFTARYEERWVPLLEALDDETGVGFGAPGAPGLEASPLLEGLDFPGRGAAEAPFTDRCAFLLNRLLELGSAPEWELTDADVRALENPEPARPPDALACTAVLAAAGPEALDRGDFQVFVDAYAGPSGARLLGRFCHGDPGLEARVREHLQAEAALRPGAVFAEIAHLPEGRMGNILCRPLLREREIPFLGASGAPPEDQIPLQDLLVSVQGGRVVLRSASLDREVLPRLTSAHNFGRGLGVYRFLCGLQDQGAGGGGWTWGPLDAFPYLPRVRRGRHVLHRARWFVRREEVQAFASAPPDEAFRAFSELAARRGFPRMAVLVDADNELLVDLQNPLWVDTLLHLVAQRPGFRLQECFPPPGNLVATGPGGRYCHQLVVPFLRVEPPPPEPAPRVAAEVPRSFPPGSEWLYLKVYTGTSTADRILLQTLAPLLREGGDLFDRWFFLRYSDPGHHLRLRFHGEPGRLTRELLPRVHALLAPLGEAGWTWKVQLDTYEREVERYGGARGILLAEELFFHDSRAVLDLLEAYPGDGGAPWRWRMGLKGVDALLEGLGFGLEARAGLLAGAREGFAREFKARQGLDRQLGVKFRPLRGELDAFLFGGGPDPAAGPGLEILKARSRALEPCLEALRAEKVDLGSLALSFAHMHLNRLLRSAQRAQEFVIYDFLERLYASRLKRRN